MEWMSECPEEGEPIGEVTDFDHIGYFYDRAIGDKKIRVCERCNSMYRSTANNQKYCTDCTKFRYNEYMAQYMRNHYQAKT